MIEIVTGAADGADVLVVPVLADRTPVPAAADVVDLEAFGSLLDAKDFKGKAGQTLFVLTPGGPAPEMLLVGLGEDVDAESLRRAAGTAARAASRYATVASLLHTVDIEGAVAAVVLGTQLGAYSFDEYRSEPKERAFSTLILVGKRCGRWWCSWGERARKRYLPRQGSRQPARRGQTASRHR